MVGLDLVAGYLFGWLVRKGRRVTQRADGQVDAALDAGVDHAVEKLHALVTGKLAGDPALSRLQLEAGQGFEAPSQRTERRVTDAVADAAEDDPQFASALREVLMQLAQSPERVSVAGDGGAAVAGAQHISAQTGGFAANVINGGVQMGNPPVPGPPQS